MCIPGFDPVTGVCMIKSLLSNCPDRSLRSTDAVRGDLLVATDGGGRGRPIDAAFISANRSKDRHGGGLFVDGASAATVGLCRSFLLLIRKNHSILQGNGRDDSLATERRWFRAPRRNRRVSWRSDQWSGCFS